MTVIKLHFDIPGSALHRLLMRCSHLDALEIYVESRYGIRELYLITEALVRIGHSLQSLCWVTNASNDDPSLASRPIFDSHVLQHLRSLRSFSATSTDVCPTILRILPPSLEALELHSLEEPGVYGLAPFLLEALADTRVDLGALKKIVLHDSWWEEWSVEILRRACSQRRVELVFLDDHEDEDEVLLAADVAQSVSLTHFISQDQQ